MFISKSAHPDSEPYVLALSNDEFLHLYGVLCSLLSFDNSDKMLVELERRMIDIL